MADDIDHLLDEILVDAYGDDEQLTSFEQAFIETGRFPFPAQVVGTTIDIVKVTYGGNPRQGLTAVGRRDGQTHRVALADLVPGPVSRNTAGLINAYRRWLGLATMRPIRSPDEPWMYQPVATRPATIETPLALNQTGLWDPADQYWGEEGNDIDPEYLEIIDAGPRLEFEMEQVLPDVGADDWDLDPITDAADLHAAGRKREAVALLEDLIAGDERCIDAWVHLGNFAFDSKGPKAALDLYDMAVAIGERSLPPTFNGVLPRGLVDNRPFHRALHGLGICAWRQRRWDDAERIFTNLLWIDGCQTWTALECLGAVRAHRRWASC